MRFRGVPVKLRDGLELTDQTKNDIYQAWLDLQQLKLTQGDNDHAAALGEGGRWRVACSYGREWIDILGYNPKEKKKKRIIKEAKRRFNFIPGFSLLEQTDFVVPNYWYDNLKEGTVAVCNTPDWVGRKCYIETI